MLLQIDDLCTRYGKLEAVRNVTLSVDESEMVCVVGPNGAGKSTLLSTIGGLLSLTAGKIIFDGAPIARMSPEAIARLGISLVLEGRHVFSRLTVVENLRVGAGIRKGQNVEADLQRMQSLFPILRTRWNGAAGKLSGGEQQQLVIARALMTRPRLMMIDEPGLGLAPRMIELVYTTLSELRAKERLTLLIVEQSLERALKFADRIYVLRGGQVQYTAKSSAVDDPAELEAAYFGFSSGEPKEIPTR